MGADLTPERLKQFIDIADPIWVNDQLVKYEAFRRSHSTENGWLAHGKIKKALVSTMGKLAEIIYHCSKKWGTI